MFLTLNGPVSDLNRLLEDWSIGFGAGLPRSPKSNGLLGRLLLLGDLGKPAPNPIVY